MPFTTTGEYKIHVEVDSGKLWQREQKIDKFQIILALLIICTNAKYVYT
jgi:hypothetical protein